MADSGKITVTLRDSDLRDLVRRLSVFADKMKKKIASDAMYAGAKYDLEKAKALVPVKTGNLKKSLAVRRKTTRQDVGAVVLARRSKAFPGGYYSHLVEKGHKIFRVTRNKQKVYIGYFSGHPFMRPAVEQNYEAIIEKIKEAASKGINEAMK